METLEIPHFHYRVHIAYFTSVTNAPSLRRALVDASQLPDTPEGRAERARLDWAFVEAKMVTSREHLLAAVHQALQLQGSGELKTKTVHSEILWTLCPTNNIADAIKKFGLSATTTSLLLVKLTPSPSPSSSDCPSPSASSLSAAAPPPPSTESLQSAAQSLVQGSLLPTTQIPCTTDWQAVRKAYKLNGDGALVRLKGKEEEERRYVDRVATSLVAAKLVLL